MRKRNHQKTDPPISDFVVSDLATVGVFNNDFLGDISRNCDLIIANNPAEMQ